MGQLGSEKILFVDIQTSGGSPSSSSIIEMAWAIGSLKEGFLVKSSFVALREDDSLSSRVSKLTGIIADELEDAPTLGKFFMRSKKI